MTVRVRTPILHRFSGGIQRAGQIEFSSAARLTVGSTSGCGRELFAEASAKAEASPTGFEHGQPEGAAAPEELETAGGTVAPRPQGRSSRRS